MSEREELKRSAISRNGMQAAQCAHTFDQDELFRLLTVEKCRFENVFNATSDGVLVMPSRRQVKGCGK